MDLTSGWLWFNLFLALLLSLDLGVFNRKAHQVTAKEATIWTVVWISLAIAFNVGVYYVLGTKAGLEWTSGYLIEKALSVDNVFVIAILMSAFAVPDKYRHRLLFFGVIGALLMRLGMILAGAYLLEHWHWLFYVFGAFLIFTGWRMFSSEEELNLENQPFFQWLMKKPLLKAKPFLLALIAIETTDVIFAIDSIPAIFAITSDPFIVYSSNAFAILGLRSLYFLLADSMRQFHYLKHGLGIILALVGTKMMVKDVFEISPIWSLIAIAVVLAASIIYSIRHPQPAKSH